MKKSFLSAFILLLVLWANGQENKKVKLDFYGFIRTDAYLDTYKGVDAGHDIFYLMPQYSTLEDGSEPNKQLSSNISAIASRLGVKLSGPELFNAKTRGLMEFDFAGDLKANPTLFRIRQAYMSFDWEKSSLLVGHTWHPFSGGAFMPVVAGLNTGAPFNCFNRSPQIRYNQKFNEITLSATALSELQYCSIGIESWTYTTKNHAKRNGVIPELVLSAEWNKNAYTAGIGARYVRTKPCMTVTGTNGTSIADEYYSTYAMMAYMCYKKDKLMVLAKGFYGQDMTNMSMFGGMGISSYDAATGKETYTPYNSYSTLLNATYGQKWQGGLFLGYSGNLGTVDPVENPGYFIGNFINVESMCRIAPHISYNIANFRAVAEYEVSSANYYIPQVTTSIDDDALHGLFDLTHRATNNRLILVLMYMF